MKTPAIIFILASFFSLFSCTKDETYLPKKFFEGSYEWQVTQSTAFNGTSTETLYSIYPNDVGHNYGIRIKKSGRCFLFIDGKLSEEGEITDTKHHVDPYYTGFAYQLEINWEESGLMTIQGPGNSELFCRTFPINEYDCRNQFIKTDN